MSKEVSTQVDEKEVKYSYLTFWKRNWKDNIRFILLIISIIGIYIFPKYIRSLGKRIEQRDSDINNYKYHYKKGESEFYLEYNKSTMYMWVNAFIGALIACPIIYYSVHYIFELLNMV